MGYDKKTGLEQQINESGENFKGNIESINVAVNTIMSAVSVLDFKYKNMDENLDRLSQLENIENIKKATDALEVNFWEINGKLADIGTSLTEKVRFVNEFKSEISNLINKLDTIEETNTLDHITAAKSTEDLKSDLCNIIANLKAMGNFEELKEHVDFSMLECISPLKETISQFNGKFDEFVSLSKDSNNENNTELAEIKSGIYSIKETFANLENTLNQFAVSKILKRSEKKLKTFLSKKIFRVLKMS